MKLINPYGKIMNENSDSKNPRGCTCSSSNASMFYPSCWICGCQCDHGETNRQANDNKGFSKDYF